MGKYILVTGGEMFNKGAQAMTFVTVSELAKRFPDKKVVLVSSRDFKRPEEEKNQYCFDIIPSPKMKTLIHHILRKNTDSDPFKKFMKITRDSDAMVDISGYALGSNWRSGKAISYVGKICFGVINRIPIYLMPQSFGPFEFKGFKGKVADKMIGIFLPKAEIVMVRETDGIKWIKKKYPKTNYRKTYDLVLENKGIDLDKVFKVMPTIKHLKIPGGSVALVPNSRTIMYGSREKVYTEYRYFIDRLLENGKTVFLIYHAVEDYSICKDLKNFYSDNQKVILIDEELSCLDFDENVRFFDFIVGSRFHSIVHAYKNAVPAIVLGWAVKYNELLELFGQKCYQFDSREENSCEKIKISVDTMCRNYYLESEKIKEKLKVVQEENVFDFIHL